MKTLIVALAIVAALCAPAKAGTTVMQVDYSSFTVGGVAISSQTGTSITTQSGLGGWRQACIQNLDTTNALYVGDSVNVSTSANVSLALLGNIIPPATSATSVAAPLCFILVEGQQLYARTGSQSGTSNAIISRAK